MAQLWIREYRALARNGSAQAPLEPGTDQSVVTFSASAQSAAFAAGTSFVALIADAAFHYVVGANPTATTGALKVPANTLMFIGATPGHKVAAIAAA
jgi:hypothetical protein